MYTNFLNVSIQITLLRIHSKNSKLIISDFEHYFLLLSLYMAILCYFFNKLNYNENKFDRFLRNYTIIMSFIFGLLILLILLSIILKIYIYCFYQNNLYTTKSNFLQLKKRKRKSTNHCNNKKRHT